ncbi:unnamed protein product [Phytomonas sp. EM1]|nr:unnamed protein product [Phytomonas sp. EM1]|eukprot:CCW60874.1 unnamed protein product [Phytomonas sp. isolate EM1]
MTMSSAGSANPDSSAAFTQLKEAFSFLDHEREDVRKMAVQGIASQSKEDKNLWAFMSSAEYGPAAIDALLKHFHPGSIRLIGNILTILINSAADGACAEMLVTRKIVRKSMLFLDEMEHSTHPEPFKRSVQEMVLMLLNNLTASHISAVDDLLQKDDDAMRGFYLGKLHGYYVAMSPGVSGGSPTETPTDQAAPPRETRDCRRWILSILLNLTRSADGQELLLEDEDWRGAFQECLRASGFPSHRRIVAECFRNCAGAPRPLYGLLLQADCVRAAVEHLTSGKERDPAVQMSHAEVLAGMLESVEGVAQLEGVNAKKLLSAAVSTSRAAVEAGEESAGSVPSPPQPLPGKGGCLAPNVCDFLEKHVLVYLDDIIDAYLPPNCDDVD